MGRTELFAVLGKSEAIALGVVESAGFKKWGVNRSVDLLLTPNSIAAAEFVQGKFNSGRVTKFVLSFSDGIARPAVSSYRFKAFSKARTWITFRAYIARAGGELDDRIAVALRLTSSPSFKRRTQEP